MCISLPRFGNFWISFLTFLLLGFHNANITCLMVPQNSHRLSSCLLIFLSFCSYDCIISNEPVFKLTNSFFCLIESALDALYCTFLSFIVFSALEFVWFLLLLYWTSHFIHIPSFLTLLNCLYVFSWSSPNFLKVIILNFLAIHGSSILWGSLIEKLLLILWYHISLLFCFL